MVLVDWKELLCSRQESEQSDLKKIQPKKISKYQLQNYIQILKSGYITLVVVTDLGGKKQINISNTKTQLPTFIYVMVSYRSVSVLEALLILNSFPSH